jgi:hypothetical protein
MYQCVWWKVSVCVFVGQSWMKMVSVDVRWSRVECEREVREGCVGVEREVSVEKMLEHVMFVSGKGVGLGQFWRWFGQSVVRDS